MKAKTFVYAGLIACLLGIFPASAFAVECVNYITQNYPEYKLFAGSGDAKNWANLEREIPAEADAYNKDQNKPAHSITNCNTLERLRCWDGKNRKAI